MCFFLTLQLVDASFHSLLISTSPLQPSYFLLCFLAIYLLYIIEFSSMDFVDGISSVQVGMYFQLLCFCKIVTGFRSFSRFGLEFGWQEYFIGSSVYFHQRVRNILLSLFLWCLGISWCSMSTSSDSLGVAKLWYSSSIIPSSFIS